MAEGCHVTANVLHPGIVDTDLFQNVPPVLLSAYKVFVAWMFKVYKPTKCFFTSFFSRFYQTCMLFLDNIISFPSSPLVSSLLSSPIYCFLPLLRFTLLFLALSFPFSFISFRTIVLFFFVFLIPIV